MFFIVQWTKSRMMFRTLRGCLSLIQIADVVYKSATCKRAHLIVEKRRQFLQMGISILHLNACSLPTLIKMHDWAVV